MAKLDEQISVLQDRLTQLKVRQQRLDARKQAVETQRERKLETRRNVLVGSVILAKVRDGGIEQRLLRGWLDSALTKAADRALFDLPPLAPKP